MLSCLRRGCGALTFAVAVAAVTGTRPGYAQEPPTRGAPAAAPATPPRDTFSTRGATDVRYRETDKAADGSYVAATRLTTDWTRRDTRTGRVQSGARIQFYLENDGPRDTGAGRLRASEAYGFYEVRLPGVAGRLQAGQFALPFGLTALYDPLQPIQPLYEKSLGLRVDTGVLLAGTYGPYAYTAAVTTGSGPNRSDFDGNKVVSVRLERTVATELGIFVLGGSLLTGRGPVTGIDTQLPASGTSTVRRFVDKTRFAGDGQYAFGNVGLRGEVVFGADGDDPVWGYFAEGNYQIRPRLTLVAVRRLWNFAEKPQSASSTGLGLNFEVGNGLTLRTLYEFERDVPLPAGTASRVAKRLTLQTRLSF